MEKIKFIMAKQDEIATEPMIPGSLICTDEQRLYWDQPDGVRSEITDVIELPNEMTRESWPNPRNKFYYVIASNRLYRYQDGTGWQCLNDDPEFIGPDGKILIEYLPGCEGIPGLPGTPGYPGVPGKPGDVVLIGPEGVIPEGYLPIATETVRGIATLGSEGGAARYGHNEDVGLDRVTNDTQVKATDVEDTGPDDRSGRLNVTSAARLYQILGGQVEQLVTGDKTLIGAINAVYNGEGKATIPPGIAGQLVTFSGKKGEYGEPRPPESFLGSPEAQLPNDKLLVAPATKGGVPGLKSIAEFASSSEVEELREIITEIKLETESGYIRLTEKGTAGGVATLDENGRLTFEQLPSPIPGDYVVFNDNRTFQEMLDSGALRGEDGKPGPQGPIGPKGPQGAAGAPGAKGDKGDQGDKGEKGDAGPAGLNGQKGDKGDPGPRGPQGIQGLVGPTGPQGPQGIPTTVNGLTGENITITASHITSGTLPTGQLPIVPVSKGGTGQTTLINARGSMGLGYTTGALPVANGGTGATNAATARSNLGALGSVFQASASAPADGRLLWIDTSQQNTMKYWNGSSWVAVRTIWA